METLHQEMAVLNRELLNAQMTRANTITPTPSCTTPSGTVSPTPTPVTSHETIRDDASTSTNTANTVAAGAGASAVSTNVSAHELQRTLLVELAASVNSELTDAQALIASQQQELSYVEAIKERCEAQEILIAHFRQIVADLTGETKGQLEQANAVIERQQQEMSRLNALSNTFRSVFKELAGTVSEELTKANAVIPSQRLRIDDLEAQISELQQKLLGFQTDDRDHNEGLTHGEGQEEGEEEGEEEKERGGTELFSNDDAMPGSPLPCSPLSIATLERAASADCQGTPGQLDKNTDLRPLSAGESSPLSVEILDAAAQPKNITIIDLTYSPPPPSMPSTAPQRLEGVQDRGGVDHVSQSLRPSVRPLSSQSNGHAPPQGIPLMITNRQHLPIATVTLITPTQH